MIPYGFPTEALWWFWRASWADGAAAIADGYIYDPSAKAMFQRAWLAGNRHADEYREYV